MGSRNLLVKMENTSVVMGGATILFGINFKLYSGDNWAILGPNGAGKSTFLKLLRGEIWPLPNVGKRVYYVNGRAQVGPIGFRDATALVSPELLDSYKRNDWNIPVEDVISSGFWGTAYLHHHINYMQKSKVRETMARLRILDLAGKTFNELSFGQGKKVLIARAVVADPKILILDEIGSGLDSLSLKIVLELLEESALAGVQIICSTHVESELIPSITNCAVIDKGRIVEQGNRSYVLKYFTRTTKYSGNTEARKSDDELLISVKSADVFINGVQILDNINWEIRKGQNWAVAGENGSGKTTLLKLITGEIYPAWGGSVKLPGLGFPRTLWEIRRKIGQVSDNLQVWHEIDAKGIEVVLSGFFGSFGLNEEFEPEQLEAAKKWIDNYNLRHPANSDVRNLSYGQLRMLLILRAMVMQPEVLVLDEPLTGLDAQSKTKILELLDSLAQKNVTLLYVSHRLEELPQSISHLLYLKNGAIGYCGRKLTNVLAN